MNNENSINNPYKSNQISASLGQKLGDYLNGHSMCKTGEVGDLRLGPQVGKFPKL